jgi:predicted RNase H-like nuclease (RuvC/YqgF family)
MSEFQPITTQEEFDERLKGRLARERERWEKESVPKERAEALTEQSTHLGRELEAKEREIRRLKAEHILEMDLRARGLSGPVGGPKAQRIKSLVNLDTDDEEAVDVSLQLEALRKDVPELFEVPKGAGSGGSSRPVLAKDDVLTREQIEELSPEEMAKPGVMAKIDAFMKGER